MNVQIWIVLTFQEIYEKGGRKFGILNLPPLGCLPAVKAIIPPNRDGCVEEITQVVKLHNEALSEALHSLHTHLQDFKYSYIDFYTSINQRIKSPSKYGNVYNRSLYLLFLWIYYWSRCGWVRKSNSRKWVWLIKLITLFVNKSWYDNLIIRILLKKLYLIDQLTHHNSALEKKKPCFSIH